MARALYPFLICLTLVAPACGSDSGGEDTASDAEAAGATTDASSDAATGTESDAESESETGLSCTTEFVSIATGTSATNGVRPCGIGFGAAAAADAEALAACGGAMACYTQIPAMEGYCGVMVMNADATQFWPGVSSDCEPSALEAMLLDQCATAAGEPCETKCSQCGPG